MTKEVMSRKASDNPYLHKDFHGALSVGIEYLTQHYGPEAVREYLRDFTRSYHAPLIQAISERGLTALREHFERIYQIEGGEILIRFSDDELIIEVQACPAVTHMRERNYPVARLFYETTKTVNEALCEGTAFAAELVSYDESTGRSIQRFYRRTNS